MCLLLPPPPLPRTQSLGLLRLTFIITGSQLVDRVAALEAEKAALEQSVPPPTLSPQPPSNKSRQAAPPTTGGNDYVIAQLQRDLAEALRSKGYYESRTKTAEAELDKTKSDAKNGEKIIRELTAERNKLVTKLKDRDHELREQRKLSSVGLNHLFFPPRPTT